MLVAYHPPSHKNMGLGSRRLGMSNRDRVLFPHNETFLAELAGTLDDQRAPGAQAGRAANSPGKESQIRLTPASAISTKTSQRTARRDSFGG